jgi:hypothetical protein
VNIGDSAPIISFSPESIVFELVVVNVEVKGHAAHNFENKKIFICESKAKVIIKLPAKRLIIRYSVVVPTIAFHIHKTINGSEQK